MAVAKITKRTVEALGKGERIWDSEVKGFGARRQTTDAVWYLLRYIVNGKERTYSIGRHGSPWTPDEARSEAQSLLGDVKKGIDPLAEKQEMRRRTLAPSIDGATIGAMIEKYLADRERKLRPKSFDQIQRHLRKHAKPLHGLTLKEIKKADIAALLNEVEEKNGWPSRNHVRSNLSAFFTWLTEEDLAETNLVTTTRKAEGGEGRDRVLRDDEVREIWDSLSGGFGDIVRLLLLTGQRRNEIGALRWSEVRGDMISFPPERVKNNLAHDLPLSPQARAILERQRRRNDNDIIFGRGEEGFSGWSKCKASLDAAILSKRRVIYPKAKPMEAWTLHDLRRTVSTRMHELGVLPHIVEAVLNHQSGHKGGVAGRYNHAQYLGPMREALEKWANHLEEVVGPISPSKAEAA